MATRSADALQMQRKPSRLSAFSGLFLSAEHLVSIVIGLFLMLAAAMALVSVGQLMLVEILHTVRRSIESHELSCEPFLVVGLIATVRRILVVTLESSDTVKPGSAPPPPFAHSMIELGVLGALTIVLIVSIWIARRSGAYREG